MTWPMITSCLRAFCGAHTGHTHADLHVMSPVTQQAPSSSDQTSTRACARWPHSRNLDNDDTCWIRARRSMRYFGCQPQDGRGGRPAGANPGAAGRRA